MMTTVLPRLAVADVLALHDAPAAPLPDVGAYIQSVRHEGGRGGPAFRGGDGSSAG